MSPESAQSSFSLVGGEAGQRPRKLFCGHCGKTPAADAHDRSRVCPSCNLGLLLEAPADLAPAAADPFLVVDGALTVCALSRAAERLLGVSETEAVNRHIGEFLVPADAETPTNENLGALVAWASRGETPTKSVAVRPRNTFGVRYWAKVGPCGPPRAALLVLADAR